MKNLTIVCPKCEHEFSPEAVVEKHLREHLEKDYAEKLAAKIKVVQSEAKVKAEEEYKTKLDSLENEAKEKSQKLREFELQALTIAEKEKAITIKEENFELELKKKLLHREEQIRKEAELTAKEKASVEFQEKEANLKRERELLETSLKKAAFEQVEKVRDEERLKQVELMKKLEDQAKSLEEMKRRVEQGSVQLQGEVQEIAIEQYLKDTFPKDSVEEVAKGARGGDCVHVVKDHFGNECGKILYESKRTKSFSKDWIKKHKEDMRLKQADIGVIVTDAMPGGMNQFGQVDGVWLCSFTEFRGIALLMRYAIIRIGEVMAAQENRGDKMKLLYDYLTGNEFRQRIDAIREAFQQMNIDLQKERTQSITNFAKREKQILKVMENTMALYGEVRGIAGGAIQDIKALEGDEPEQLKEAS